MFIQHKIENKKNEIALIKVGPHNKMYLLKIEKNKKITKFFQKHPTDKPEERLKQASSV